MRPRRFKALNPLPTLLRMHPLHIPPPLPSHCLPQPSAPDVIFPNIHISPQPIIHLIAFRTLSARLSLIALCSRRRAIRRAARVSASRGIHAFHRHPSTQSFSPPCRLGVERAKITPRMRHDPRDSLTFVGLGCPSDNGDFISTGEIVFYDFGNLAGLLDLSLAVYHTDTPEPGINHNEGYGTWFR